MKTIHEIEKLCMDPLPKEAVSQRSQSGQTLSYVDQHYVIKRLCEVFGPLGYEASTVECAPVCEPYQKKSNAGKDLWHVGYRARVVLTTFASDGGPRTKEGTGFGKGMDSDLCLAHESAGKEAETDALKRAARLLGTSMGLALYDKEQADVVAEACTRILRLVADGAIDEAKAETRARWTELNKADRQRVTEAIKMAEKVEAA